MLAQRPKATPGQRAKLVKLCKQLGIDPPTGLSEREATVEIRDLESIIFTIQEGMD
jgi:hypothetical protein